MAEALVAALPPNLTNPIRAHVDALRRELAAMQCTGCAYWFVHRHWRPWQAAAVSAELARLQTHAALFGEFMPSSSRHLSPDVRALWLALARRKSPLPERFSPFDYYEAEYSCAGETRVPADIVGDGPKWLCGAALHRAPCRVLSLGSNHQDEFERSMHAIVSCTSYIVDPTLRAFNSRTRTAEKLLAFEREVQSYGSSLNASVGVGGASVLNYRGHAFPLVSLATLMRDHGGFGAAQSGAHHVSVLKADTEKSEFTVLDELWTLCAAGQLTIDQMNVEVHLAELPPSVTFGSLHRLFAGARACGLMLHHKEFNTRSRQKCAEFAWVSGLHAQRAVAEVVRTISRDVRRRKGQGGVASAIG